MSAYIAASLPRRWCTSVRHIKYIMTMTMTTMTMDAGSYTIHDTDHLRSYPHAAVHKSAKDAD